MLDAMGGEGLEGGFYAFRQAPEKPPQYLLLKERQQVILWCIIYKISCNMLYYNAICYYHINM